MTRTLTRKPSSLSLPSTIWFIQVNNQQPQSFYLSHLWTKTNLSGVDKIIRGAIAEANLDEAKHYFGVKFWGSAMTGKSIQNVARPMTRCWLMSLGSCIQVRHYQAWWLVNIDLWYWRYHSRNHSIYRRIP